MVSVVIPAKNEVEAISGVIKMIQKVLSEIEHEIVVVDDGSTDGTGEKAIATGARVIRHVDNLGYGSALKTGIAAARFDTIVIIDADGTYPIEFIPKLLDVYNTGYDMVVGARTGRNYFESIVKATLRFILKFLIEYTVGRKVSDVNSGLRVFSREKIMTYFNHLCDTFSFTTTMTLAYMMTRQFVAYIDVPYHRRSGVTKVRLFRDMLGTLQFIIEAITYYNPLKIFLLMSQSFLICSVCFMIVAIFKQGLVVHLIWIVLILMSASSFSLGLLSVLLRQILIKDTAWKDANICEQKSMRLNSD